MLNPPLSETVSKRYYQDVDVCNIPHVFRVAQVAYKKLIQTHKNQCCVISGESGAGKTETAKFLVEQLLAMCNGTGALEQRIVKLNPLLEAFGNAQTNMNDNSSRFGKFLDLRFTKNLTITGGKSPFLASFCPERKRAILPCH